MLDFDLTELLTRKLQRDQRPPDGKLHPSGDLLGSLRHSQLRAAGAPTIESELLSDVRLRTGTMWHTDFESTFRGQPAMLEVKLDRWLPEGWSGTADWIVWSSEYKAFVLGDLKTIKPEGMAYIDKDGIKEEHRWQVSSYWYALRNMGLPLVKTFLIYYLPMSPLMGKDIQPMLLEGSVLPETTILPVMEDRWAKTQAYLGSIEAGPHDLLQNPTYYVTDELAPVQDRRQVIRWNKSMDVFDVKLEPHWSAMFCPFPVELCDCSTQRSEKIGHYTATTSKAEGFAYVPRKGYEHIEPTITLDSQQERKLLADPAY